MLPRKKKKKKATKNYKLKTVLLDCCSPSQTAPDPTARAVDKPGRRHYRWHLRGTVGAEVQVFRRSCQVLKVTRFIASDPLTVVAVDMHWCWTESREKKEKNLRPWSDSPRLSATAVIRKAL